LEETYEAVGLNLISERPYPTVKGIRVVLQEMASKDPKAQAARPEDFVDLTFVRELDKSGFIDRLYKSAPVVATSETAGSSAVSVVAKEKVEPAKDRAKPEVTQAALKTPAMMTGASDLAQQYTVKAGDTLSHLAARFYGSSNKWDKIFQANTKTLKNPHYIYIGQQLLIPHG
jgi:nucleoid-associated protein YgaU